jgi:hypothetical protein
MKRTLVTGTTCVGELRLTALDVGFDIRLAGHAVFLPEQFSSVGLDIDGESWLIEGTREEMVSAIQEAGYQTREPRYDDPRDDMDWEDDPEIIE